MVATANSFVLPYTGYIQLSQGYTVEYIEVGRGEPLVLVPGLAGGVELLEPLIEELQKSYRVIAYQLRGEHSLFDRNFGFHQFVDDLRNVIEELGLERPGLVGVSFGGAIALEFAAENAGRLSFLVVQGAGTRFQPGLFGDVAREVLNRLPLPGDNPFVNQFFKVLVGSRRRGRDESLAFIVNRCWRTDQCVMAHRLGLLQEYDIEGRVADLRIPTLVLAGDRDVVVSAEEARRLARRIPHARFQSVRDAGHLAFVTDPSELANRIRKFHETSRRAYR